MLLTLLSPQAPVTSVTVSLAASEAKDVASFNITTPITVSLAASEAPDVASFNASVRLNASLTASEAKDTAAMSVTVRTSIALAASEAPDVATFTITVGGGPTEQFTVSGPHVTDIFTTTTLSYPYDIKRRTA